MSLILAIESSCDDTSAAVIRQGIVLSNVISTQLVHQEYGGVIPELASRAHQSQILPTIQQALLKANVQKEDLDAIAFTKGPGLLGSLLVGVMTAKALALSLNKPLIEVNHMMAHVLAHFIDEPKPQFPFICLTVSGGHTQLVLVNSPLEMEVIGSTIDDAAGEAFDKTGKMLGLDYPSGPLIDKYAKEGQPKFEFSKARIEGLDFSYSGLKTSVLYFLQKEMKLDPDFINKNRSDLCASIQANIIDTLLSKLKKAALQYEVNQIALAGGVSANSGLRSSLEDLCEEHGWKGFVPQRQFCTDNAAMIAMAAHFLYLEGRFTDQTVTPEPRLKI